MSKRVKIPQDEAIEAYRLVQEHGGVKAAMQFKDWGESAFYRRLRAYEEIGETKVDIPHEILAGAEDEPIEDILNRMEKHFLRQHKAATARKWYEVKVKEDKPYGLLMIGDPHLGDPGCNLPLLKRHIEVGRQDGVYSVNIGDTTNSWVGRLMAKYANQEATTETERRLIEWFMHGAGLTWVCWILGNHDTWNRGEAFQRLMGQGRIPIIDWSAQFKLVHPSGTEARADAKHGRKGSSIWNNLHATLRAAKLGEAADIYMTGHTHSFGIEDLEIPENGTNAWLVQLRGYKFMDEYALHKNFAEHQRGASVLAIIDPRSDAKRVVRACFEDVEDGAEYLKWLRAA